MRIRPSRPGVASAIHGVHVQAFGGDAEARLVDLLLAAGAAPVSLVAEADGGIVGHILFSPVAIDGSGESTPAQVVGLAPLAVLPEHQRRGIGSLLVREGLAACATAGFAGAVVLGHPAFYRRFGFSRASDRGLGNDYGVDDEFMALEFREGALDGARGIVHYRPEFRVVGA